MAQRKPKPTILSATVDGKIVERPVFCPVWQLPDGYELTKADAVSALKIECDGKIFEVEVYSDKSKLPKVVTNLALAVFWEETLDPKVYGYNDDKELHV